MHTTWIKFFKIQNTADLSSTKNWKYPIHWKYVNNKECSGRVANILIKNVTTFKNTRVLVLCNKNGFIHMKNRKTKIIFTKCTNICPKISDNIIKVLQNNFIATYNRNAGEQNIIWNVAVIISYDYTLFFKQ